MNPTTVNGIQGDYGYEMKFQVVDANQNPVDLTGVETLLLLVQDAQDPSDELLLSGTMAVDTASQGLCHYTVAQGAFPAPGTFNASIQATFSGMVITWPNITIVISPSLPKANN